MLMTLFLLKFVHKDIYICFKISLWPPRADHIYAPSWVCFLQTIILGLRTHGRLNFAKWSQWCLVLFALYKSTQIVLITGRTTLMMRILLNLHTTRGVFPTEFNTWNAVQQHDPGCVQWHSTRHGVQRCAFVNPIGYHTKNNPDGM